LILDSGRYVVNNLGAEKNAGRGEQLAQGKDDIHPAPSGNHPVLLLSITFMNITVRFFMKVAKKY
jgi:hypothetical protein